MTDGRGALDRLVETDELARGARAWRAGLATAAAIFGVVPVLAAPADAAAHAFVRFAMALWSAFVVGWIALALHGLSLARERRRLERRLAAIPPVDHERSR